MQLMPLKHRTTLVHGCSYSSNVQQILMVPTERHCFQNDSPERSTDKQCLNCEKEVVERWKRGAKGAETNTKGVRIEAL